MALKPVALDSWRPDSGFAIDNGDGVYGGIVGGEGMVEITNLVETGGGYSGLGIRLPLGNLTGGYTGVPQRLAYNPSTGRILVGTTGSGTASQVYDFDWATQTFGSSTALATGIANADWNFVPWGTSTIAVAGTAHRLKISTATTPAFTNIGTDIRPKFACRFGQRIFVANCAWTIGGLTTSFASPDPDAVFASTSSALTGTLSFGDAVTSGGLGAANWFLKDEFGPITGMAATETYILICKPSALIIGRRTTQLDIDWSYMGSRYGCTQPRSLVVDGEDIYLWANCGPIKVVGGEEIEEIGTGNFSFTLEHQNGFGGKQPVFLGYDSTAIVEGVQDPFSGIIVWSYTPGLLDHGTWTTATHLNRAVSYNPNTKKASILDQEFYAELGAGGVGIATSYGAACAVQNRFLPTGYSRGPLTGVVMIDNVDGLLSNRVMPLDFATAHPVHLPNPTIRTHWFGADNGGDFRILNVNFPFANGADFGQVSVTIRGIADRGTGAITTEGPFTGWDAQGRIDTANSSTYQIASLEITLGDLANDLSVASWAIRNFRLFEIDMEETTYQAAL